MAYMYHAMAPSTMTWLTWLWHHCAGFPTGSPGATRTWRELCHTSQASNTLLDHIHSQLSWQCDLHMLINTWMGPDGWEGPPLDVYWHEVRFRGCYWNPMLFQTKNLDVCFLTKTVPKSVQCYDNIDFFKVRTTCSQVRQRNPSILPVH